MPPNEPQGVSLDMMSDPLWLCCAQEDPEDSEEWSGEVLWTLWISHHQETRGQISSDLGIYGEGRFRAIQRCVDLAEGPQDPED
ncbi:hypothetical protein ES703_96730 [subsurface metagenome]